MFTCETTILPVLLENGKYRIYAINHLNNYKNYEVMCQKPIKEVECSGKFPVMPPRFVFPPDPNETKFDGAAAEAMKAGIKYEGVPYGFLAKPQVEIFDRMYNFSGRMLKIITLAPEPENAFEVIKKANKLGVRVSAGHCNTSYEIMKEAIDAAVTHVTHTFNVCPPLSHRNPGMLGAAFNDDRVSCEVICDFYHVLPPIVQIIHRLKGPGKFVAVRYAGIETDEPIHESGRTLYYRDGVFVTKVGTVCGSGGSMHMAVKNLHSIGIPLWEISEAVSLNPAREIFADDKCGSIKVGKCADFALLDKNLEVKATFVNGTKIY